MTLTDGQHGSVELGSKTAPSKFWEAVGMVRKRMQSQQCRTSGPSQRRMAYSSRWRQPTEYKARRLRLRAPPRLHEVRRLRLRVPPHPKLAMSPADALTRRG